MSGEELTIYYPSGRSLRFFGRFVKHGKLRKHENSRYAVAIESLESVVLDDEVISPGSIAIVDPRGVIVGKESGVIYTPRPYMQDFPNDLREWMKTNADWPIRLNLDGDKPGPGPVTTSSQRQEPE